MRLSNWSRLHTFEPRSIHSPATLDELLAVVETCGRSGRKVKPAGSLHSWSACAVTDDASLHMTRLNQVLNTDAAARTVTVQAGLVMRDLYTHLERSGLALPCLPNVDAIQVGGAIANATHGTCIKSGSMCSLVTEIQMVVFTPGPRGREDGRATLITLRRDNPDPHARHLFEAAVASVGSLGVLYAITLQCVPPYHSYVHELAVPFDTLEHRFEQTALAYYSCRFMWHPHNDLVFTKVQVPIAGPLVRARARSHYTPLDILLFKIVSFATERNPQGWHRTRRVLAALVDRQARRSRAHVLATHSRGLLTTWYDAELESRLHAAFAARPFTNLEYAIPLDRFDDAIGALLEVYKRYPSHPMAWVSFRPVGADDAGYLVPSKGTPVVFVDVPYVPDLEAAGLYGEVERTLIARGGRCSWSRRICSPPEEFLKNYPERPRFIAAKQELDAENVFSNPFSDRICGVGTTPVQ